MDMTSTVFSAKNVSPNMDNIYGPTLPHKNAPFHNPCLTSAHRCHHRRGLLHAPLPRRLRPRRPHAPIAPHRAPALRLSPLPHRRDAASMPELEPRTPWTPPVGYDPRRGAARRARRTAPRCTSARCTASTTSRRLPGTRRSARTATTRRRSAQEFDGQKICSRRVDIQRDA